MRREFLKDGVTWFLDTEQSCIDDAIARLGFWEPWSTMRVRKLVKPGWVCLDVGANIGYYTVVLSRLVGATGAVLACEPDQAMYDVLVAHCERNQLTWALPVKRALGTSPAEAAFVREWAAPRLVNFIKVDVDGPDLKVMQSLAPLIREQRPVLLFEVCDYTLQRVEGIQAYGYWARQLMDFVVSCGYQLRHEETWEVTTPDAILLRHDLSKYSVNLFGFPI